VRRRAKGLDYFQRAVDLVIVYAAWSLAYFLRFVVGDAIGAEPSFYFNFGLLLVITSLISFKNNKLYDQMRLENQTKEIATQLKANVIAFVAFLILAFFISNYRISRLMLVIYFIISSGLLIYSKIFFRKLLAKKPIRLAFVGNGEVAKSYYNKLKESGNLDVLFWVDPPSNIDTSIKTKEELDFYKLERADLDGLVIGYDNENTQKGSKLLEELSEYIIPIIMLPDVSVAKIGYSISEYKGQPLIYINEPNIKQFGLIMKRVFDFTATLVGMLLISPILIMIAVLVKTTSRGPIFYGQVRMGVDGREFKMWKFRSMITGEANTEGWTVKDDPRVTRVGKFLRKSNLDELPQLWNILVGDMSLVGPRPERPQYVEKFREEIPGYMIRHKFKAGLTGWAQVNGWRGDTSIEKRIECDLWYIKNWSFFLDLSIIFMTFFKGNKNAY
jgi:exopolysaccharide biosynthesis polyprenyl glycosylphosphotransferase